MMALIRIVLCVLFMFAGLRLGVEGASVSLSGDEYSDCLLETIETRETRASVVLSAKVLDIFKSRRKTSYSANIQVKRVFKGESIVTSISSMKVSHRSVYGNYNKVIKLTGLGSIEICDSDVMNGDTKIFFVSFNDTQRVLTLQSSMLQISMYNLKRVEAAAKNIPFDQPAPVKSPCTGHFCAFHASCIVNETSHQPMCVCQDTCKGQSIQLVCGTDGNTYSNECQLKLASCYRQRRIKVEYFTECHDPCDGYKCDGYQVCKVDDDKKPICRCETSCEPVFAAVCGSDGQTYSNACMLRQQACESGRDILILYEGKCKDNPCSDMKCETYQECVVDNLGLAKCVCPSPCQQVLSPVCSSDDVTYDSECELRRQACLNNARIYVLHPGICDTVTEDQGPCAGFKCHYDADCIVRYSRPQCECPICRSQPYGPVCGDNGIVYENDCQRRKENCEQQKLVEVEHRGMCMSCKDECEYYSSCERSDGLYRCVCPTDCVKSGTTVCGTDGQTYDSECELRVASCKNKIKIMISSFGECVDCNGVQCKYGSDCVHGMCVCPQFCPKQYTPVCADDGKSYHNECEMRREACRLNKDIEMVRSGECNEDIDSGSGEGSGLDCDDSMCEQFGGICYLDMDRMPTCSCDFSCDAIRSPVCGSDGKTYGNRCELKAASCQYQKHIVEQSMDSCDDMDEILCDGMSPVINSATRYPYNCAGGHDCPAGSYCHLEFGKCCNEDLLSDNYIRDCTESTYGCCDDRITFAPGPDRAGCPDQCQCHSMGSLESTCNPVSKQCPCKPGIGGLRCERCLAGYWGLHLLQNEGRNQGCLPCNCHRIGSSREDCNQNTGRCECRPGYDGHKCQRCKDTGQQVRGLGCSGGQEIPCGLLKCRYGATCHKYYSIPQCICELKCSSSEFPTMGYVCGTNRQTYISECNLYKDSCLRQALIQVDHYGPCKDSLTLSPTDVPYTPRSRKTTRHIQASNYMTPGKPGPTSGPPVHTVDSSKYGRIGDLCLEDSYCFISNSHCRQGLCKCNNGYIPTFENTQCSKVKTPREEVVIPEEVNTCSLNPCLHSGICKLEDSLGYRCLCQLGRMGTICKKRTSFKSPSFSGSSYLMLRPFGNLSEDFYLDISFHSLNKDGMLLFSSQNEDGTGQYISIAISNGHVEFRYDTGHGPRQIRHPNAIRQDRNHQVIAQKTQNNTILIVDNVKSIAAVPKSTEPYLDLSGKLYVGFVPQNFSFIFEKVGVNLGFVGCLNKLTAGHPGNAQIYNLAYPSQASHILDGLDIGICNENPCGSLPCKNGATCMMLNIDTFKCLCVKGYTGSECEDPLDICTNSPCDPSATCSLTDSGEFLCHCPETREGAYCEYEKLAEIEVPEFHGDSYIVLPVSENLSSQSNIDVWLLTTSENGMIMFSSQYLGGKGDYLSLNIMDRYVELRFDLGDSPVIIRSSSKLELNTWHRISVKRLDKEADLTIDDGTPSHGVSQGLLAELQFAGSLYVGGYNDVSNVPPDSDITKMFTGVIQRIYINGEQIEKPMSTALESYHVTQYKGKPCLLNPCMNGGVCVPKLEKVDCKCPKRFMGQYCERMAENLETSLPVKFDGSTYLQYYSNIINSEKAQKTNKFQFRFRTHQSNGMLIFQGQGRTTATDYLAIVISDGYVEMGYNLGKQRKDGLLRIRSSVYVSDGNWHTVHAERDHRKGTLQVDKEPLVTGVSESGATQLDTDGMLWLGGHESLPSGLPLDYYRSYKGCLGSMFIQDRHLHLYDHINGLSNTIEFCH